MHSNDSLADRFRLIRNHYKKHGPQITRSNAWDLDPYEWDVSGTGISLSPIEQAIWMDIRAEGAVFYPQFPVGRFFVDFANPVAKVAIECDGAAWHVDKDKDAARQAEIERAGWTVYRISGKDCKTDTGPFYDANGDLVSSLGAARAFIKQICAAHSVSFISHDR